MKAFFSSWLVVLVVGLGFAAGYSVAAKQFRQDLAEFVLEWRSKCAGGWK